MNKTKTEILKDFAERGYITLPDGMGYVMGLVDEYGNPIERTPQEFPYSFDTHVLKRWGENDEANGVAWSDHLGSQYPDVGRGFRWDNASKKEIKDYLNRCFDYEIEDVILLMKGCNQARGFPLWVVKYKWSE